MAFHIHSDPQASAGKVAASGAAQPGTGLNSSPNSSLRLGRSPHRGAALLGAALACVITANSVHRVKNTKTGEITVLRRAP